MRIVPALFVLTLMASCVAPPAPPRPAPAAPRPPVDRPAPAPAALPADWRDWPLTPGDWRYRRDGYGTRAVFASAGVVVSCDADRAIRLRLDGRGVAPITVRTSTTSRTVVPTVSGRSPADATLALAARDPLLDAIAFSRGRWTIEQPGAPPLVLPAFAEVARVIEDCRS